MNLSLEQLQACYPKATTQNVSRFFEPLKETIERYEINTDRRLAFFLAQAGHETKQLEAMIENLNYSAERLLAVFPKYFDAKSAVSFAHKPQAIANVVYANRLGNGNPLSNDGWTYRGRGYFHHTGKEEYDRLSKSLGVDLVNQPELLEGPLVASLAAGDFWKMKSLNNVADKPDDWVREWKGRNHNPFEWCCVLINGGYNGLDQRTMLYGNILKVITSN